MKLYDFVYVVDGEHIGAQGIIIKLEKNQALVSTGDNRIMEVHPLDLSKTNVNIGIIDLKANMNFKRFDLVLFGNPELDVGCIIRINNNLATVMDINNRIREENLHSMSTLLSSVDSSKGLIVKVRAGFYAGISIFQ